MFRTMRLLVFLALVVFATSACQKNPNAPTSPLPIPPPAVNSIEPSFEPRGPYATPVNEGDTISLPYGSALGVKIEYTVSDEVWARRANSDYGLSIYSCFGRSTDTIVLYCRSTEPLGKLLTQTGVIVNYPFLPDRSLWNTVTQTLTQVNIMTEGSYLGNGVGGTPESWLDFPISQLPAPLVQKTVTRLTVNWTH